MKIYETTGFPNPARVRIALAEKGLTDQVTFEEVDVMGGAHRRPEFTAKNPTGTVPLLELADGTFIGECSAITEYLDHLDNDPVLTGRNAKERAEIAMMQRRVEAGLMDAVGNYFHHATPGLGPDLEVNQVPAWGEREKDKAQKTMRYLDSVLAEQPFVAGDRFTVADITAIAGLGFADFAKVEIPADLAALHAWRIRVTERPSVAA
ncbi:MAG: glutathione S-transferase [Pseudomonadota bacterium]